MWCVGKKDPQRTNCSLISVYPTMDVKCSNADAFEGHTFGFNSSFLENSVLTFLRITVLFIASIYKGSKLTKKTAIILNTMVVFMLGW